MSAVSFAAAACVGHDPRMFDIDNPRCHVDAMAVCRRCPIIDRCRELHEGNPNAYGVYGGIVISAGIPVIVKETKRPAVRELKLRRWTEAEKQFLRDNAHRGAKYLTRHLNREYRAVHQQAYRMGISVMRKAGDDA